VAVVRGAIGPSTYLMVDANHAYTSGSAIRMGRALEKYNVLWFEEPVPPEDHQGYRRVRDAIDVPVAGGEAEFTRYGFRDLLLGECLDIAQPDLCCAGEFTEWQKITALTTTFGALAVPHVRGSGVAVAAALQALAAAALVPFTAAAVPLQNEPMIEYDRTHNPLRDDLLVQGFRIADGAIEVPC
jgi:D-galactarolactone cycloisomerase